MFANFRQLRFVRDNKNIFCRDQRENALDGHPWRDWAAAQAQAGRMPGMQSRWNAQKDLSWEPLRVELVAEVRYEHVQAGRFRHGPRFRHWRPDREPTTCTLDQLDEGR